MLEHPGAGLHGEQLLAGRFHQLALAQHVGAGAFADAETGTDQRQHVPVGVQLGARQLLLGALGEQFEPGVGHLGGQGQRGGLVVGATGRHAEGFGVGLGAHPPPQIQFVLRRQPGAEQIGLTVAVVAALGAGARLQAGEQTRFLACPHRAGLVEALVGGLQIQVGAQGAVHQTVEGGIVEGHPPLLRGGGLAGTGKQLRRGHRRRRRWRLAGAGGQRQQQRGQNGGARPGPGNYQGVHEQRTILISYRFRRGGKAGSG